VLDRDVFVNVAGGVHLTEPAIDLGIACAIVSAARGRAIDAKTVVFGEVGLAGEVRAVAAAELRIAEAKKLGFSRCILPAHNRKQIEGEPALELVAADRLSRAIEAL
jgi:DNA repair protein RadA/Sms